jgi:hypothetical protein
VNCHEVNYAAASNPPQRDAVLDPLAPLSLSSSAKRSLAFVILRQNVKDVEHTLMLSIIFLL